MADITVKMQRVDIKPTFTGIDVTGDFAGTFERRDIEPVWVNEKTFEYNRSAVDLGLDELRAYTTPLGFDPIGFFYSSLLLWQAKPSSNGGLPTTERIIPTDIAGLVGVKFADDEVIYPLSGYNNSFTQYNVLDVNYFASFDDLYDIEAHPQYRAVQNGETLTLCTYVNSVWTAISGNKFVYVDGELQRAQRSDEIEEQ